MDVGSNRQYENKKTIVRNAQTRRIYMYKVRRRFVALMMVAMMVIGSLPVMVLAYGYEAAPYEDGTDEDYVGVYDCEYEEEELFTALHDIVALGDELDMYAPGGISDPAGPPAFDPVAAPTSIPPAIPLPNRRITPAELDAWVANYHDRGGINEFEREILRLTNIERVNHGLQPVVLSPILSMAARFKSQGMSNHRYFAHESPIYGHWTNISRQLFNVPDMAMGENLGRFQQSPQIVVTAWMNSPGHRANLLNPRWTELGAGAYNYHWTQKFAEGSTLHIPVPAPPLPDGVIVDSWEALRTAVNAAPMDQAHTIHIASDILATSGAITIPSGRHITLVSTNTRPWAGNVRTLTQRTAGQRHFIVGQNSSLTLCQNILLQGPTGTTANSGGIRVNGGGELIMNSGSTITSTGNWRANTWPMIDGAVELRGSDSNATQARMTMLGGAIYRNTGRVVGGVLVGENSILVMKYNSAISSNESLGGGFADEGGFAGGVSLISDTSILELHDNAMIENNAQFTTTSGPFRAGGVAINRGTATMYGGSIANNYIRATAFGASAGVSVMSGSFTMHDGNITGNNMWGVSIRGAAIFTMNGGIISDNGAAGVRMFANTFNMTGGIISGNDMGVNVGDGGVFTMSGGTISDHTGNGVLVNRGVFNMTHSNARIENNHSSGINLGNGYVNITGGVIAGNSVNGDGGGINLGSGTLTMTGGYIINNSARNGGGVFVARTVASFATFNMSGGTIANNEAAQNGGGIFAHHTNQIPTINSPIAPVGAFSNINIGRYVTFFGNTAGNGLSAPPENYGTLTHIATRQASRWNNPINNFDINFIGRLGEEHGVSSWEALRQAVNNAPINTPTTIYILSSFYAPAPTVGNAIIIPANRQITLVSSNTASGAANIRTIDQFNNGQRHFIVNGSLTLGRNITLRTGSNSGGVQVAGGSFNMEDGSAIIGG